MFCKYCGKPLTGTLCSYCGKETTLRKSSSELDRLMAGKAMQVTPKAPPIPDRKPEKTYQQGYDEGYRKGSEAGYSKGTRDSQIACEKKFIVEKAKLQRFAIILCGIVFLLGAVLSGWIFGNIRYTAGYNGGLRAGSEDGHKTGYTEGLTKGKQDGYQEGLTAGRDQAMETLEEEYKRGYLAGYQEAEAAAKAQEQPNIPAMQNTIPRVQQVVPEVTSPPTILYSRKHNNGTKDHPSEPIKKIQARLQQLGYLDDNADGIIGKKTEAAIKEFQKANGLQETGEIDIITYQFLIGEQSAQTTATPVPDSSSSNAALSENVAPAEQQDSQQLSPDMPGQS